jgi:hypothetical protein
VDLPAVERARGGGGISLAIVSIVEDLRVVMVVAKVIAILVQVAGVEVATCENSNFVCFQSARLSSEQNSKKSK